MARTCVGYLVYCYVDCIVSRNENRPRLRLGSSVGSMRLHKFRTCRPCDTGFRLTRELEETTFAVLSSVLDTTAKVFPWSPPHTEGRRFGRSSRIEAGTRFLKKCLRSNGTLRPAGEPALEAQLHMMGCDDRVGHRVSRAWLLVDTAVKNDLAAHRRWSGFRKIRESA